MQGGKELRDDRVDQAGRWGKECRSTMLKVAVIGVMGALLALLLKGEKAGQSLWVVLAAWSKGGTKVHQRQDHGILL